MGASAAVVKVQGLRQASNVHIHNAVSTLNSPMGPRSFSSKAAAAPNNDHMCGDIDMGALTRAVDAAEARAAAGRAASFNAPCVDQHCARIHTLDPAVLHCACAVQTKERKKERQTGGKKEKRNHVSIVVVYMSPKTHRPSAGGAMGFPLIPLLAIKGS